MSHLEPTELSRSSQLGPRPLLAHAQCSLRARLTCEVAWLFRKSASIYLLQVTINSSLTTTTQ